MITGHVTKSISYMHAIFFKVENFSSNVFFLEIKTINLVFSFTKNGSDRFRPKQISAHMEILTDFVPHRFRPIF